MYDYGALVSKKEAVAGILVLKPDMGSWKYNIAGIL